MTCHHSSCCCCCPPWPRSSLWLAPPDGSTRVLPAVDAELVVGDVPRADELLGVDEAHDDEQAAADERAELAGRAPDCPYGPSPKTWPLQVPPEKINQTCHQHPPTL